MKGFIIVAAILFATYATVKAEASPAIPHSAETLTDVCLVYSVDGAYFGGIGIHSPNTVSVKSQDGFFFLWLPGRDRIKVDTLGISPLPPDNTCVGIV